jgi:hypothetical protein
MIATTLKICRITSRLYPTAEGDYLPPKGNTLNLS